jgi:hypothetical protein
MCINQAYQAFRYYNFGEGMQLMESTWKQNGDMATLTVHRDILSSYELQWRSTTCSTWSKKSDDTTTQEECNEPVTATVGGDGSQQQDNDDDINAEENDDGNDKKEIFDCPEDGCIAKFQTWGRLQNHVLRGIHNLRPERITMKDYALQLYSASIENIQMDRIIQPLQDVVHEMEANEVGYENTLKEGWALPPTKTKTVFTPNVKRFLDEKFMEGERSKQKFDPKKIEELMEKSTRFSLTELKNYRQIASYFSRKAARMRNIAGCTEDPSRPECPDGIPEANEEGDDEFDFENEALFIEHNDALFDAIQEHDGSDKWPDSKATNNDDK